MRDVRISDMTMKRAESSKSLKLSFKEKLELAKLLDKLGVSIIEVEGISNEKVDSLRIKSLALIVKNSVLAVPVSLDGEDAERIWGYMAEAPKKRLQVSASVSPAQMEYLYHKKADKMVEAVVAAVQKCASIAQDVEFIAEDATRADRSYLLEVIDAAIAAGATTVTVCDDAGAMLPDEFGAFITGLLEDSPALKGVSLGISCSDAIYMADSCATAGIIAGVNEVKATSYPMDIASIDKIAKILYEKKDVTGARTTVRTTELKRITTQIRRICDAEATPTTVFAGSSEADESIVLTKHDSMDSVIECAKRLGYELSSEDALSVYETFQRIAVKKDVVGSRELDAIVAAAALQVPATYTLDKYIYNSSNVIKATAHVQMLKGDQRVESVACGDGPVDAAFLAIENIVGAHYELDDFQIQAVAEGKESTGETVIKLISNGKVYSGRGVSTDIIGSSIRAFVNAVNKIIYEEQN